MVSETFNEIKKKKKSFLNACKNRKSKKDFDSKIDALEPLEVGLPQVSILIFRPHKCFMKKYFEVHFS